MKRLIYEGQLVPKFYALAYYDFNSDIAVYYPFFINILVYAAITIYYFLVKTLSKPAKYSFTRRLLDKYIEGYMEGVKSCKEKENNCST